MPADQKLHARIFLKLLRVFKPRLLVHGHVHVYRNDAERISRYKETTIINVYPYRVLDLTDDEILVR